MAVSAEAGGKHRRGGVRTIAIAGAAGLAGYLAGIGTDPASTSEGGGVMMNACMDGESTHRLLEGDYLVVGVGDLSVSGFPGGTTEDALRLEMVDGALGITDLNGAEEYAGGEFRVASEGNPLTFEENGATMTIGLEEGGVVRLTRQCPEA